MTSKDQSQVDTGLDSFNHLTVDIDAEANSEVESFACDSSSDSQKQTCLFYYSKNKTQKRTEDVLAWDEYFMASAFLVAKRSKDPVTRVGAVIVNKDNKIVGTGYNGMPRGCSDDSFPWGKSGTTRDDLHSKYLYVCHAEMNAILNKNSADTRDCRIYSSLFPCNECAKIIIQSGINEVIFISDKYSHKPSTIASKIMFDAAKVSYRQYKPQHATIVIDMYEGVD